MCLSKRNMYDVWQESTVDSWSENVSHIKHLKHERYFLTVNSFLTGRIQFFIYY